MTLVCGLPNDFKHSVSLQSIRRTRRSNVKAHHFDWSTWPYSIRHWCRRSSDEVRRSNKRARCRRTIVALCVKRFHDLRRWYFLHNFIAPHGDVSDLISHPRKRKALWIALLSIPFHCHISHRQPLFFYCTPLWLLWFTFIRIYHGITAFVAHSTTHPFCCRYCWCLFCWGYKHTGYPFRYVVRPLNSVNYPFFLELIVPFFMSVQFPPKYCAYKYENREEECEWVNQCLLNTKTRKPT